MSGHNKWTQIKHKKAITDQKKAKQFTKLLAAVGIAAKMEPNPDFNPRLRTSVEKAREANVPKENIDRAINKAKDNPTDELVIEAYGPSGTAFIIKAITDSRNRTISEIKKLLSDNKAKFAEQGSVAWMFDMNEEGEFIPKLNQSLSEEDREKVISLMEAIDEHDDISEIFTNAEIGDED